MPSPGQQSQSTWGSSLAFFPVFPPKTGKILLDLTPGFLLLLPLLNHCRQINQAKTIKGFSCVSAGKESSCSAGDMGSIPGLGRSPREGTGNPLQYSCLENTMDRGGWWGTVHVVAKVRHFLATNHHRGAGNGTPLQYSCLENHMDGGSW